MSAAVELEIQTLLNEFGDAGLVADKLIQSLESTPDNLTAENVQALSRYLWHCGFFATLHDFILRHVEEESFEVPWDYFGEALGKVHPTFSSESLAALREGIQDPAAQKLIARTSALDAQLPEIPNWRRDRRYHIHKDYAKNKKNLIDQLVIFRTQQLYEQEKTLLARLQKIYPGDDDVNNEIRAHQQRYALDILARRTPQNRAAHLTEPVLDADQKIILDVVVVAMLEETSAEPALAYDFAVAAWMLESYDAALELLKLGEETDGSVWFKLECLLKARRFLELLQDLSQVEYHYANDPETFFATAYLRAQALWGIGQKHTAIEVIESLATARPHYRAANSLLQVWRGS